MNPPRIFKYAGRWPAAAQPGAYLVLDRAGAPTMLDAASDDELFVHLARERPGATWRCEPSMADAAARWPCEVRALSPDEAVARAHLGVARFLPRFFDLVDRPDVLDDFFRAARAVEVACREAVAIWHPRITVHGAIGATPLSARLGASFIGGETPDLALGAASDMEDYLEGRREIGAIDRFAVTFLAHEGAIDALRPVYGLDHAPRPLVVGDRRPHPADAFGLEELAAVLTALAALFTSGTRQTRYRPSLGGELLLDIA